MLYHRYAKGEVAVEGFLDDYAFTVYGLVQLYEATFSEAYLQAAADLTKNMISRFWDQRQRRILPNTKRAGGHAENQTAL